MSTKTNLAIEARGVVKRYGEVMALDGLDLTVPRGGCFGLLGPNGAGKTTLVSILATLARPDAGSARLFGHDVVSERAAVRQRIGIVFQESALDRQLTGREHLDLHARLYHLADRKARVEEALRVAGLEDAADRPVHGWSGGMRRRLELARGLLHGPPLLFLDEPTLGLDVAARAGIWERLRALRDGGETTLFLTTHSMEEADALCQQLAIVDRGRLAIEGAPEELKAALGGDLVILTLRDAAGAAEAVRAVADVQVALDDGKNGTGARLRIITPDGPRRLPALLEAARGFGVEEVRLHRPSLEDVFLHHTGHPFEPFESGAERAA